MFLIIIQFLVHFQLFWVSIVHSQETKLVEAPPVAASIVSLQSKKILFSNFTFNTSNSESPKRLNYVTLLENSTTGETTNDFQYKFECAAAYPVEWRYEGEGLPCVVPHTRRILEDINHFQNPPKYKFSATLLVRHEEKGTGKYICQSLVDSQPNSSVAAHIFFPGPKFFVVDTPQPSLVFHPSPRKNVNDPQLSFLFNNQSEVSLGIRRNVIAGPQPWITIPCAGSSFSTSDDVELYRVVRNRTLLRVLLERSDTLHFDPFLGFRIKSSHHPWGDYICKFKQDVSLRVSISPQNDDAYLSVSVGEPSPSEQSESSLKRTEDEVHGESSDDDDSDTRKGTINFNCSTSYPNVHIQHVSCFSVMDCNFRKIVLRNSFVPLEIDVVDGSVLVPYPISRQTSPMKGSQPQSIIVLPSCGLFYCSAGRQRMEAIMFFRQTDNSISIVEDLPDPDTPETLELRAHQSTWVGGSVASFTCYGRTLFFSNGFLWKGVMADGREEFMQGDEKLGGGTHFIENSIRIPIPRKGGGLKSLTCFAPVWNSRTQWGTRTMEFGVGTTNTGLPSTGIPSPGIIAFISIRLISALFS